MVNILSVFIAGIAGMLSGLVWYSPLFFGKKWQQAASKTKEEMKDTTSSYAVGFVSALLMAYVLAKIISYADATNVQAGLKISGWVWLGFLLPVGLNNVVFEKNPLSIFFINMGYYLVSLVIMAAIIVMWV